MFEAMKDFAILQFIEVYSFCRFVFQNFGYDLERGIVIVTDDDRHAQEVADAILATVDSRNILHYSSKTEKPFNFEIGLHLYRKYDKEEELINFLFAKDFVPLIIVGGLVPEFLTENAYIFRLKLTGKDIRDFKTLYEKMKTEIKSHIEHLSYEIQIVQTSRALKNSKIEHINRRCFEVIVLTGKVWQMVIRESNDEDTTEAWVQEYYSVLESALESMDDLIGICDVSEAVRKCVVTYILQNEVKLKDFHMLTNGSIETIWYDTDYYYFSEPFLKKICKPLQNTVSFQQIKTELYEAGILVCNNTKNRNFTVKKSCFDIQTGYERRIRFLKLVKQELFSDEGMELEELVEIKRVNNKTEKEGFEYGNDHRICEGEYQGEDF